MARFTRELRQQIIREFAIRHNGNFNPALFLSEVESKGAEHPAYEWFEWDQAKAAREHQIWQAREFANGLKVSFTIEEIGRNKTITVREVDMPFMLSPGATRTNGGGYVMGDAKDEAFMAELCRQAAVDLRRWFNRYQAALLHIGVSLPTIEKQIVKLEGASQQEESEAA